MSSMNQSDLESYLHENCEKILDDELFSKTMCYSKHRNNYLTQYAFNVDIERNYRFDVFLIETIIKKISILNEILIKFLNEYFKIVLNLKSDKILPGQMDKQPINYISGLSFTELKAIKQIYKNNLIIFKTLLCNGGILGDERLFENVKFSVIDFFVYRNCVSVGNDASKQKEYLDIFLNYHDIHYVYENTFGELLKCFRDIFISNQEAYTISYTSLIDTFSGTQIYETKEFGND